MITDDPDTNNADITSKQTATTITNYGFISMDNTSYIATNF